MPLACSFVAEEKVSARKQGLQLIFLATLSTIRFGWFVRVVCVCSILRPVENCDSEKMSVKYAGPMLKSFRQTISLEM